MHLRQTPASACLALGLLLLAAGFTALAQEREPEESEKDPGFRVIIHSDNPAVELEADLIAKMFRKKIKRWDHDVSVVPVDLRSESPIRKVFTRGVHKKSVTAIDSYWQRMIFSGRESPPLEVATEEEVLAFVRGEPGAIGYVSADKKLDDEVKELKIVP